MVVEYNICTSSLPILTYGPSIKEKKARKNNISSKRCKSYYYICLGSLMNTIYTQIEKKYTQKDYLYLIGSRYMKDFYKWIQQYKYKELLANDFFKSFITSVALFVVGVKLASELVAWKVF